MDKIGTMTKNITPAATNYPPVREVEFGCEHIQEMLSSGNGAADKFSNSIQELQRTVGQPLQTQVIKSSKDTSDARYSLTSTYLCVQCANVSSAAERPAHAESKGHMFSIESRSGCLWCAKCSDFVYDPEYERWRIDDTLPVTGKKRKRSTAPSQEDKYIYENTNSLSCLAGEPRGLYNLGQTCYMSVILQAIIHNPLMRNHFLSMDHDVLECDVDFCVLCALTETFINVVATEKLDGYGPIDMLWKSWKHSPSLQGYQQQDAHEYFQSLLDHLHKCTGKTADSRNCRCAFHQIFWGRLRSTVTCMNCRNVTTADDPMNDLSLDLRQQAKRRKLDPKNSGSGGGGGGGSKSQAAADEAPLELTDCLRNYTSPEKLGMDAYTCHSDSCGDSPQRARKHLTIKKLPLTLCIQLKRYEQNHPKANPSKIDTPLRFPMQLDMTPYTSRVHRKKKNRNDNVDPADSPFLVPDWPSWQQPLTPRSPGWYDLYCVVVHVGKIDAGHYICYCRRDGQWFKYDDSKVTVASEKIVLEQEPYLLFYIVRSWGPSSGADTPPLVQSEDAQGEDE